MPLPSPERQRDLQLENLIDKEKTATLLDEEVCSGVVL
jgi:hypothetical protein